MLLDVTDFGAVPGDDWDAGPAVRAALRAAGSGAGPAGADGIASAAGNGGIASPASPAGAVAGPVVLRFPPGEYHFWPERAQRRELYVSNTVGDDPRQRVKTIALLVEGQDDLVITGEGARLILHGIQTTFAVIDSARVRVEGLEFDFAVPTVVDATVVDAGVVAGHAFRLIKVPATTLFEVEGRSIRWHGELLDSGVVAWEGRDALEYTQIHDPAAGRTRRGPNPLFTDVRSISAAEDRLIRIEYTHGRRPADAGLVYSMRLTTRDHPGALVLDSTQVTLSRLRFGFLHGPGVVVQSSADVEVEACLFQAPEGGGRHSASFADFIQYSGCSGRAVIRDCLFDGPHDDAINVHGTYLRVTGQPGPSTLELAYAHPETAGFSSFTPGDEVEIVDRSTLRAVASATVASVDQPTGRDHGCPLRRISVTARSPIPGGLAGWTAVENVTRTPEVHITGCVFRDLPTRAVLVTTRRPILIEKNRFERPAMAAIYVSCDAGEWWESGPVRDLTIRDNEFIEPGGPAVSIDPRTSRADPGQPVHSGVVVTRNRFVLGAQPALWAKSTRPVHFAGNDIVRRRRRDC